MLSRLLTGEIDLADEALVAAMQADPEFAKEVHALHSLSIEIDLLGPGKPTSQAPVPVLAPMPARPHTRRWLWPLIAAAALVAAGVWLLSDGALPFAKPDTTLESELWPAGTVTSGDLLRRGFDWSKASGADQARVAKVSFTRADGTPWSPHNEQWAPPKELKGVKVWSPTAEFVADLPDSFRWKVTLELTGSPSKECSAIVTLSR